MVANEMVKRRIHFLRLGTEKLGVWKLVNGYPKMDGELKWMIWGAHPYFWKQPNIPRLFCPSGVLFSWLPRRKFESNADKKSLLWPTSSTTSTADAADSDPWSLVRLNVTHVRDRQNEQARKCYRWRLRFWGSGFSLPKLLITLSIRIIVVQSP